MLDHINFIKYYGGRLLWSELILSFIYYDRKISVCPFQKQNFYKYYTELVLKSF